MPSAGKHLRNAQRHYAAAMAAGEIPPARSWAAVALFYSAHQLVHAVLDGEQALAPELRHPSSHGSGREGPPGTSALVRTFYGDIELHYKSLFGAGLGVRYEGALVTGEDFKNLVAMDYGPIAAWARRKLLDHGRTLDPAWP